MTFDEAVAEVQLLLGFRRDLDASIRTQIKHAQQYFEKSWPEQSLLPWFLITERAEVSTVANEERLPKPVDWLGDWDGDGLWLVNEDDEEVLIHKYSVDDLRQLNVNGDPGFPGGYGFDGYYYRLFPTPDRVITGRMQYFQADVILSGGSDTNKWLTEAPDILVGRAGAVLAGAGGNARMNLFLERMKGGIQAVNTKSIWIQETNSSPAMNQVA